eukprot:365890-Chlamydomonas_euryale.AAC.10
MLRQRTTYLDAEYAHPSATVLLLMVFAIAERRHKTLAQLRKSTAELEDEKTRLNALLVRQHDLIEVFGNTGKGGSAAGLTGTTAEQIEKVRKRSQGRPARAWPRANEQVWKAIPHINPFPSQRMRSPPLTPSPRPTLTVPQSVRCHRLSTHPGMRRRFPMLLLAVQILRCLAHVHGVAGLKSARV